MFFKRLSGKPDYTVFITISCSWARLVPKLKIHGAIPPLFHKFSLSGA